MSELIDINHPEWYQTRDGEFPDELLATGHPQFSIEAVFRRHGEEGRYTYMAGGRFFADRESRLDLIPRPGTPPAPVEGLADCPFCGGLRAYATATRIDSYVHCPDCDATGPNRESAADARTAWNRRAG